MERVEVFALTSIMEFAASLFVVPIRSVQRSAQFGKVWPSEV